MKVILLKDVRKVGKKYEIKDVSDGFALNFLIPRKLAEVSSAQALKKLEQRKSQDAATMKVQEDLLLKNLKSLEGATVTLQEQANDKGHLFKGVHSEEIVTAIREQLH